MNTKYHLNAVQRMRLPYVSVWWHEADRPEPQSNPSVDVHPQAEWPTDRPRLMKCWCGFPSLSTPPGREPRLDQEAQIMGSS